MSEQRGPDGQPYKVGRGKPPLEHRFKKGEPSRNPRGRPRGSTRQHPLLRVLQEKITLTMGGKRRRVTIEEALSRKVIESALKGDYQAIKAVLQGSTMLAKAYAERAPTREEILQELEAAEAKRILVDKVSAILIEKLDDKAAAKKASGRKGQSKADT